MKRRRKRRKFLFNKRYFMFVQMMPSVQLSRNDLIRIWKENVFQIFRRNYIYMYINILYEESDAFC